MFNRIARKKFDWVRCYSGQLELDWQLSQIRVQFSMGNILESTMHKSQSGIIM